MRKSTGFNNKTYTITFNNRMMNLDNIFGTGDKLFRVTEVVDTDNNIIQVLSNEYCQLLVKKEKVNNNFNKLIDRFIEERNYIVSKLNELDGINFDKVTVVAKSNKLEYKEPSIDSYEKAFLKLGEVMEYEYNPDYSYFKVINLLGRSIDSNGNLIEEERFDIDPIDLTF